jgi:6-phosphogluconolactonase
VLVVDDLAALADEAAARIERLVLEAPPGSRATIALAGGATPRATYQHLAARCPPWGRVEFFFSDERCVPPDDAGSNYRMAREALLDRIPLRPDQVHRIPGELPPEEAAAEAERALRAAVPGDPVPVLDLVLLGMGPDGHTASLYPNAPGLDERERLAVAAEAKLEPFVDRVTLTAPALSSAPEVVFIVTGESKAEAMERAFGRPPDPAAPASLIRSSRGRTRVVADAAAAASLSG